MIDLAYGYTLSDSIIDRFLDMDRESPVSIFQVSYLVGEDARGELDVGVEAREHGL